MERNKTGWYIRKLRFVGAVARPVIPPTFETGRRMANSVLPRLQSELKAVLSGFVRSYLKI